jgi:ATP-dependent DNA helicase DinG
LSRASSIFSAAGPIARSLGRYEHRDAQIQMAEAVERVIEHGGILLAEAGTGTGKTLAYLVPAVLSEASVIISTGTKNLQEQVFFKDVAFLENALQTSINAVYLKGQNNYLCLRRFSDFLRSPKVLAYKADAVGALQQWATSTETGDRMELEELADQDPIWREVCSTRETRIGSKCPFAEECFVTRARQRAMQANIVVVNHHMYFASMATRLRGGSILPPHDVVIFDEAHAIEDVATEFFSITVSPSRIERLLEDALISIRAAKLQDDPAEGRRPSLVDGVRAASRSLFAHYRGSPGRRRLVPEQDDRDRITAYHRLDNALDAVALSLQAVEGRDEVIDHARAGMAELRADLSKIMDRTIKGFVHWVETRKRSVMLGASPIDISQTLREGIFFSVPTVVLTSATLSTGGNFKFLKSRLGLDFEVTEHSWPSPFEFEKQACLYLPAHLPDPRQADFTEQVAGEAADLIALTGGGALLLFTSIGNMSDVYERLKEHVKGPLLIQGEAPKTRLLNQFMENPGSVLCATASFWQGVDIPGHALRLVIIDKLPFSSPSDPLTAARIEYLAEQGQKPFTSYQVPEAALFLRQGFGRLIRTRYDTGLVAIMDKRLHTMSYASIFRKSLPSCPTFTDLSAVKQWWDERAPRESV